MVAGAQEPAREPRYVNGFVDGTDLLLLYRDARGQMLARRKPAEWSSFYRREDLDRHPDVIRDLRNSEYVAGIREEGAWYRVRWKAPEWRSKIHEPEVKVGDEWKPGYFASRGIVAFEADVDPIRRFFSETGAQVAQPRRCYVDIETDSRVPPALARKGKARVLAWSIVVDDRPELDARSTEGLRLVAAGVLEEETDDAERQLLEAFWQAAEAFDQLVAWFGDIFDFPILRLRSQLVGAKVKDFRRYLFVDQAEGHEKMNKNAAESGDEKESMALDHVARELVGEGKVDFDASKTYEEWAAGGERRARLVRYMIRDTSLLPRIERKTGYIALNATLCEISRNFQTTASFYPIPIIDGFLLRMGVERGLRFATKQREHGEHKQFAGAWVLEPKVKGIRKNVHCVDFSGMYPSIMISWNLSPDTMVLDVPVNGPIPPGRCRSPSTRVGTLAAPLGIVPEALLYLKEQRKYWLKKAASLPPGTPEWYDAMRRSNAFKVAMNAFYGGTGSPFCRFHERAVAESTAQNGVWLIQKTIHAAEERTSLRAVYGDTDSSMFEGASSREQVDEFVRWCNAELYPKAVAECGCAANYVEIAYEKEFERVVFVSKKRYFGVFRHFKWTTSCTCTKPNGDPGALDVRKMTCRDCGKVWTELPPARGKPEVKGLEYKRGDTNLLARRLQWEIIERISQGCEDPGELVPIIEAMRKRVLEEPLAIREVQTSQGLTKSLREYKARTTPTGKTASESAHVRIARILKDRGEQIEEGVKISYYVVDGSVSPQQVAPAADYDGNPDRFYLWEDRIYPATMRVLEAAFPAEPGMTVEQLQMRDWGRFEKVRPRKARARAPEALSVAPETRVSGKSPKKGKAQPPSMQFGLFAPPPVLVAGDGPFVIELDVARDTPEGARCILAVKHACRKHPGERDVVLMVQGEVVPFPVKVAVSSELLREVETAKEYSEAG